MDPSKLFVAGDRAAAVFEPPQQSIQEQRPNSDLPPAQPRTPTSILIQPSDRSAGVSRDTIRPVDDPTPPDAVRNEKPSLPTRRQRQSATSTTSTNSKIRMVWIRRKNLNILSYENVNQVPANFILIYDCQRNKWCARLKGQFTEQDCKASFLAVYLSSNADICSVRRGTLCQLPRSIWLDYRVPSSPGIIGGIFRPWTQLSLSKNVKRIFGRSRFVIFIEGRRTTAELRAELNL